MDVFFYFKILRQNGVFSEAIESRQAFNENESFSEAFLLTHLFSVIDDNLSYKISSE